MAQFRGQLGFCSNFWPCQVNVRGITYPSSEHAFMAGKTFDEREKEYIASLKTPQEAKAYGREIKLREDWEYAKSLVMLDVLMAKFNQNPDLLQKLKEIPDEALVEYNEWHDNYWGICTCEKCPNKRGKNMLGRLLRVVKHAL